jgi:uncharacterized protein (TIGR03086 family)
MDRMTMQTACESTERVFEGIREEQLGDPTPCAEWDVRSLMSHVVGTLYLGAALLSDSPPGVQMVPGALPDGDVLGNDPVKAYRMGVEGLLAVAGGDALTRTHVTPLGEMPGAVLGGFTTLDILVHGWDLARATGQPSLLPDDIAQDVLGFAQQAITVETRGSRIGPAVAIDAGATTTDRLVAFLGRCP